MSNITITLPILNNFKIKSYYLYRVNSYKKKITLSFYFISDCYFKYSNQNCWYDFMNFYILSRYSKKCFCFIIYKNENVFKSVSKYFNKKSTII